MSKDTSNSNLDLSEVGNEDLDQLAQKIEGFYKKDSAQKQQLSYNWERNQLFLDGRQWLVYDGGETTGGLWKRLEVSRANEYIPRPVTNYLFDAYQTLKSYLIKNKPRSTVKPNTQLWKDKNAAKLAELCNECNWERLKEEQNYEYAAGVLVTYGTVFKKDYWDNSGLMTAKIPRIDMQSGMPAMDPMTGEQLFDEVPLGDINTDVIEPYRIALDPSANDIHKIRWIMEYSIQPLQWIRSVYGKEGDGYTGKVDDVEEETQLQGGLKRMQALKNSSGVKDRIDGTAATGGGDEKISNSAVVKEYYERPSAEYPKGRMVVVANNICLYAGDSPYSGPELGDWHPFSECRWEIVPGRFWGKSPLDPACEIQKQINSIDATIILTRKTMAIPQKLIPMNAGIAHGSWTGRPGQEIFFRTDGGALPQTIPSAGVDPTVFQERAQRVEDIKNVTGAIDILKGDRPPGVNAASALELLYEVGTGKIYPVLDRWKKFVESSQKKQLKGIAKGYKEPRPQFIALMQSRNDELSKYDIERFIGSDLYDNCNVVIEAGSNVPKLQAAKKSQLQESAQAGALALENPANRAEYNRQMGIVGFDNDFDPDQKRAEWENDMMDNADKTPEKKPVLLQVDNHDIHMQVIADRMKKPSFMELPQPCQMAYNQHYMEHMQAKNQQMMEEQMNQMQQTQATGGGSQPSQPGQASQPAGQGVGKSVGKGASKADRAALSADLHVPGGNSQ